MEDGALFLQLLAQLHGVGQIAVMGQGHTTLMVVDDQGLYIALVVRPGGGITHMAHSDVAAAQALQPLWREHVVHQSHIPVGAENTVVIDHHAGAFLPPVLQGEQTVVYQVGQLGRFLRVDAENAAFLMDVAVPSVRLLSLHHDPSASS